MGREEDKEKEEATCQTASAEQDGVKPSCHVMAAPVAPRHHQCQCQHQHRYRHGRQVPWRGRSHVALGALVDGNRGGFDQAGCRAVGGDGGAGHGIHQQHGDKHSGPLVEDSIHVPAQYQVDAKAFPRIVAAIMCQNVTISDSAVAHCRVAQSLARRHLDDVAGAGRAVVAQEFIAVGAVLGLGVIPQEVSHHDGFVLRQVEFLLYHAAVFHAQHSIGPWNRLAQIVGLSQHETPHESRCLEIEHAIVEIHINRTLLDAYLAVSPDVVRLTAGIEGDEAHVHRVLFLQLLCRIGHGQDGSGIKRPCCTQGAQHRHAVCF